jgi:hypothetical protein
MQKHSAVYAVSRRGVNAYSWVIPSLHSAQGKGDFKEKTMRDIRPTTASTHYAGTPLSHPEYLRILQDAKTAALAARSAAIQEYWASLARAVRHMGQHASVRLGAGHRTVSIGV